MFNPFKSVFYYFVWLVFFGFLGFSSFLGGPYGFFRFLFWVMIIPIILGFIFLGKVFGYLKKIDKSQKFKFNDFSNNKNIKDEKVIDVEFEEKK